MASGWHLDLRDPDGIALESTVPNARLTRGYAELRDGGPTQERVDARVRELLAEAGVLSP